MKRLISDRIWFIIAHMLLSDGDIKTALLNKSIVLDPLPNFDEALSACSIDLRLHNEFQIFDHDKTPYIDPRNKGLITPMKIIVVNEDESFILHPGEFALASTMERIELPDDIAGRLEGRSSLGRLGIVVHSTAALIHPGMRGNIVLELGNHSRMPVALYPGMRICSVSFEKLTSPAQRPYYKQKSAKYLDQHGTTGSRITNEQDK